MSTPTTSAAQRGFRVGRKKIKIARIEDERSRQVTFLKRRNGVMKKAHELAVLTGSEVGLIIFNGQGKLSEFCSGDMRALLRRYAQHTGPTESRGPQFYEDLNREKDADDDDEETVTSAYPPGPSSSVDGAPGSQQRHHIDGSPGMPYGPTMVSPYGFGSHDTRQPMNPPSSASFPRSSLGNAQDMSRASVGSSHDQQGNPNASTAGRANKNAADLSPVSFTSSRASSITGHMSGVQISGTPQQDGVFTFGQQSVFPTAGSIPQPHHQLLSGSSLATRRSSFPAQLSGHALLAGSQIVRPSTSAGGFQPGMQAMAPPVSPFTFQGLQPASMTFTPSMQGQQGPPSAWQPLYPALATRPQLYQSVSDSRMPSTTSFMMEHESPFVAENDGSHAGFVEGINQALLKRRKMSGRDWDPSAPFTACGTPLRFSATIPVGDPPQNSPHPVLAMGPNACQLSRPKEERSQSFHGITGQGPLAFDLMGLPSSADALRSQDPGLSTAQAHGASVQGGDVQPSSGCASSSLSPNSTGASAPGAGASITSGAPSIFESPSLANSGAAGESTQARGSNHSGLPQSASTSTSAQHGAGGDPLSLQDPNQASALALHFGGDHPLMAGDTSVSSLPSLGSRQSSIDAGTSMTAESSGMTSQTSTTGPDSTMDFGAQVGQIMENMMSQDSYHAASSTMPQGTGQYDQSPTGIAMAPPMMSNPAGSDLNSAPIFAQGQHASMMQVVPTEPQAAPPTSDNEPAL